jgi:hypothetical protein
MVHAYPSNPRGSVFPTPDKRKLRISGTERFTGNKRGEGEEGIEGHVKLVFF